METRDEYVEAMKSRLDEWNQDINQLEKRMAEAKGQAASQIQSRVSKAKDQYEALRKQLETIRTSEKGWDDLKDEADHVWKALKQSANYFRSEL